MPAAQHLAEVVGRDLLELLVAAGLRVAVGAPPLEVRGVPEPPALHVLVADLDHPLGPQRREGQVLALAPAALGARDPVGVGGEELLPVAPRVLLDRAHQRLQLLDELGPARLGEAGADADVLELALVVVEAEQEAAEQRPLGGGVLVLAVAGDDHVGGARVLDLEHGAAVLGVRRVERLGDHAVEPGALELVEPALRLLRVLRGAGQVAGPLGAQPAQRLLHRRAPLAQGPVDVRLVAEGEQVEGHEAGRRLLGQHVDPGLGRVDPLLQHLELEPVADGDEHLAVEHHPLRQLPLDRLDQLGEVARQRLGVAAGQLHLVAVAEHDAPEPVPLRLEDQPVVLGRIGDPLHRLGEHRLDGWHHRQVHAGDPNVRGRGCVGCVIRREHPACSVRMTSGSGQRRVKPSDGASTASAERRSSTAGLRDAGAAGRDDPADHQGMARIPVDDSRFRAALPAHGCAAGLGPGASSPVVGRRANTPSGGRAGQVRVRPAVWRLSATSPCACTTGRSRTGGITGLRCSKGAPGSAGRRIGPGRRRARAVQGRADQGVGAARRQDPHGIAVTTSGRPGDGTTTDRAPSGIPRTRPEVAASAASCGRPPSERRRTCYPCGTAGPGEAGSHRRRGTTGPAGQAARAPPRGRQRSDRAALGPSASSTSGASCVAAVCQPPARQVLRRDKNKRYYLDLSWPDYHLVVEIDGIHHTWAENVIDDALRQNSLAIAGDTVLRVPLLGLRLNPDEFFGQIEEALVVPVGRRPPDGPGGSRTWTSYGGSTRLLCPYDATNPAPAPPKV